MDRTIPVKRISGIYLQESPSFQKPPLPNLSRTLKAEKWDAAILIEFNI